MLVLGGKQQQGKVRGLGRARGGTAARGGRRARGTTPPGMPRAVLRSPAPQQGRMRLRAAGRAPPGGRR